MYLNVNGATSELCPLSLAMYIDGIIPNICMCENLDPAIALSMFVCLFVCLFVRLVLFLFICFVIQFLDDMRTF